MSGPLDPGNPSIAGAAPAPATTEVREGRRTTVGGLAIVRVLPTKGRRTVGAWCFLDVMLGSDALDPDPMEVGPHPHIGLATATWLLDGEAVHTDSLGTEQLIRPGQLNLMTAGRGIAHAEIEQGLGLRGVQMWVAQPEETRDGASAFEHHADLPVVGLGDGHARVFMGALGGETSPARHDTPLLGVELTLGARPTTIDVDPTFEHALIPLDHAVTIDGAIVEHGWLGHVPPGPSRLTVSTRHPGSRALLLGGEPFEPVRMWWNFVARTQNELTSAYQDWEAEDDDRFPAVASGLRRITAPRPPWLAPDPAG